MGAKIPFPADEGARTLGNKRDPGPAGCVLPEGSASQPGRYIPGRLPPHHVDNVKAVAEVKVEDPPGVGRYVHRGASKTCIEGCCNPSPRGKKLPRVVQLPRYPCFQEIYAGDE